jgi:predicted Zn-dependent protease with MMP-like domain
MDRPTFEAVVEDVIHQLPDWVHDGIHNLTVVVEEWPTEEQDPDGEGLLGLYDGIPLRERGSDYVDAVPDVVYIFRQPHLEMDLPEAELVAEIQRTVLHELAHYFGFDDDHLDDIGMG